MSKPQIFCNIWCGMTHLSNQADNTCRHKNHKTKQHIIKEYKLYLSKHNLDLLINMQYLPPIYWIPKMHKNLISFIISIFRVFITIFFLLLQYICCIALANIFI